MKIRSIFILAALSLTGIDSFASVGYVVSMQQKASVERGGKIIELKIKDNIENKDILITDANGRLRIMFSDEGSVNLGSNTRIALDDIMPNGKKPNFSVSIIKGAGRFITGEIVKKNPDGYKVKTSKATIGIRGTIFAVEVDSKSETKLSVLNSHGTVNFNGKNIKSGEQITSRLGDKPIKITPEEANRINKLTSVLPQILDTMQQAIPVEFNNTTFDATKNFIADEINNPESVAVLPQEFNGTISGQLNSNGLIMPGYTVTPNPGEQTFDFYLNLGTGTIENGHMNYNGIINGNPADPFNYEFFSGSGTVSKNNFSIDFTDVYGTYPGTMDSSSAQMNGTVSSSSDRESINTSGNYNVLVESTSDTIFQDSGTFSGSGTP